MTKPSREEYEDVAYIIDNGGTLTGRGRQVAAAALRIAAEQVGEREKVERLRSAAKVLYANSLACVQFHHGHDVDADGLPPWLADAKADIDAIEAGDHSTATPVSGWRSMDSAPRDGSEFMASIENDHSPGTLFWEPRCRFNPEAERFEIWGRTDYDQDGWEFYPNLTFRSWMPQPLPSPPGGGT